MPTGAYDNERCTAIIVGSMLSVKMPHSDRDEEDYIEALETVRATLIEEKRAGAVDFFTGGELNIELTIHAFKTKLIQDVMVYEVISTVMEINFLRSNLSTVF